MFKIERAYDLSNERTHKTLEAVVGVLSNIAPLTKFQIDDALLALLKDIQKPGPEAAAQNAPQRDFTGKIKTPLVPSSTFDEINEMRGTTAANTSHTHSIPIPRDYPVSPVPDGAK